MARLRALLLALPLVLGASGPATATTLDSGHVATSAVSTAAPARAATSTVSLDGVTVRLAVDSRQVITVKHTTGYHARVSLWQRQDDSWQLRERSRAGRIGYGGLVAPHARKQATGATPLGTYRLLWAFGRHPDSTAWALPYRRIAPGDYWVEDNASPYYNRYRNKAQGGFRWWLPMTDANSSELLGHYVTQYEYSIVIGFNYWQPVRHRGAGIFFHVNGPGATAGCVSAPRWLLRRTMAELDPALNPVIAIGR
ncbi:MAG TPA: L,D-transpeptidase family protein [Marmoricola sp.]|nr:L,D-transpeptidase family protein [Marmoricola sp.]